MHRTLLNLLTISLTALAGLALLCTALAIFQEPAVVAAQATDGSVVSHELLTSVDDDDDDDEDDDDDDDDDEYLLFDSF